MLAQSVDVFVPKAFLLDKNKPGAPDRTDVTVYDTDFSLEATDKPLSVALGELKAETKPSRLETGQ